MFFKNLLDRLKPSSKSNQDTDDFEHSFQYFQDRKKYNETLAIITDNTGKKYTCIAEQMPYVKNQPYFVISVRDNDFKSVCYLSYYKVKDKLFLSSISTDSSLRNKGLASKTLELSTFLLQNHAGSRIFGNFRPFTRLAEQENPTKINEEELKVAVKKFYEKHNFDFITLDSYSISPDLYPDFEATDFTLGEPTGTLVTKVLEKQKNPPFEIINGIVVEKSSQEEMEN